MMQPETSDIALGCISCDEGGSDPNDNCTLSQRSCRHHCDHSWTHDECCWCGAAFGDVDDPDFGKAKR